MPLDLKLDIRTAEDCTKLVIEDVTGGYSDANPGGWGGFNIDGNRDSFNIQAHLVVYTVIDGVQYTAPIAIPNFGSTVYYPSENSYRGFKVSIPSYDISTSISNIPDIPESYDSMQEVVEDTLYEVVINFNNIQLNYSQEFKVEFKGICNSQKAVEKMMSVVNLGCEDCDDSDIKEALLAKSLLEILKTI
tara:strand:+ start:1770 stop:2339 length:570 start_codon:yes stop_codon:yes gene_type:complete